MTTAVGYAVRIEPLGVEVPVHDDEVVMAAAARAGIGWPTLCGGAGLCGACAVDVVAGSEQLGPVSDLERKGLALAGPVGAGGVRRLACQLTVTGDIVVVKRGVQPR